MLREAALYQYVFVAAQVETEAGGLRSPDPHRLLALLAAAVRHPYSWLGQPLPDGEPAIALPAADGRRRVARLYPRPDAPSRWSLHGRWAAYAEVYLHNGALSLRLAYGCQGDADAETYARLADAPWPLPDDEFLRGQSLCYAGRVPDLAAASAEAARLLPGDPHPLRRADLPLADGCVAWLFDRVGLPDRLALFYPDDDRAEEQVGPYLNAILPDLLLSLHKIAHQYGRGYEAALRPLLAAREAALARVLAGFEPTAAEPAEPLQPSPSPARGRDEVEALDRELTALAAAYHAFARELALFDRLAQAVRVNLLNLREGFAEHGLPRQGPPAAWLTAAERAASQMEADEGFYRARVRQAEMALAALQVRAEVERARLEQAEDRRDRQRNLLLGFIAVALALGQVLSDAAVAELLGWVLGVAPVALPAWGVLLAKLGLVVGVGLLAVGIIAAIGRWRRLARD